MYYKSAREKEVLLQHLSEVYDHPYWSLGPKTTEAERVCSEVIFQNKKQALLVNDGTHALELCLRDINVQGKKVLLPVMTVPMVKWAIERAGGIPVFVDVNPEHLQMDFDLTKEAYEREDNVGAVILVHTGGLITPEIYRFTNFCKERSLPLVEDISHAQLSHLQTEESRQDVRTYYAGTFGDYAAFSMYATKVVSVGEGGFAAKRGDITGMKAIRNQGKNDKQQQVRDGYNFRASEWTAAVALVKLLNLPNEIAHRTDVANLYDLAGLEPIHHSFAYRSTAFTMVPSFYKYIIKENKNAGTHLSFPSGAVHRDLLDEGESYNSFCGAKFIAQRHVCLSLESAEAAMTTIEELKEAEVL